ncbi:hypothetical protein Cob_v002956 [Colletotrichum orbiculare MAFF 240422]|uniref:Uncharacterized protein n=1 Tax=Colletotrichum orbiculare (strain 104-T / ATCC 96160 / CBS 514.97 / LARS 414 / MAFF 240422) TaxID=1213857 RepID=A0A484G243_COLOR|nr:hypothetical protein Cob_v002956 [Colletotrichum orbiculare MAFF 240422]
MLRAGATHLGKYPRKILFLHPKPTKNVQYPYTGTKPLNLHPSLHMQPEVDGATFLAHAATPKMSCASQFDTKSDGKPGENAKGLIPASSHLDGPDFNNTIHQRGSRCRGWL